MKIVCSKVMDSRLSCGVHGVMLFVVFGLFLHIFFSPTGTVWEESFWKFKDFTPQDEEAEDPVFIWNITFLVFFKYDSRWDCNTFVMVNGLEFLEDGQSRE